LDTDIFEIMKIKNANKRGENAENKEDLNFIINREITCHLHYFFCAFISIVERSDEAISDLIKDHLIHILKSYLELLATKDRELMHHVLFTFRNYHLTIFNLKVWAKMPEEVRELYI
jgi:hypothetical protein